MPDPQIIEFIGAPGVGKSSLVSALKAEPQARVGGWDTPQAMLRTPGTGWRSKLVRALPTRWRVHGYTRPTAGERSHALLKYGAEHEAFVNYCIQLGYEHEETPSKYLLALDWMIETFATRALLANMGRAATVLMDEPLSFRPSLFPQGTRSIDLVEGYVAVVPLPAAAIHLDADTPTVQARIRMRKQSAVRHRGLSDEALRADLLRTSVLARRVADGLATRGVPVMRLDATQSIAVCSSLSADFISSVDGVAS